MPYRYFILFCLISGGFWGCRKDFPVWGKYAEVPPCTVEFSPNGTIPVPAGMSVNFTAAACPDAVDFTWCINDQPCGSGPTFSTVFPYDDTVKITLTVHGEGLGGQASHMIIVRPQTLAPTQIPFGDDPDMDHTVWGVDAIADTGYCLMVNDIKSNYWIRTNHLAQVVSPPMPYNFNGQYARLNPKAFLKTTSGYLSVGVCNKSNGQTDFFAFKALAETDICKELNFVSAKGKREQAFGVAEAMAGGNYLICGDGEWNGGQKGMYIVSINQLLENTSLIDTHFISLPSGDTSASARAITRIPGTGNPGFWLAGVSPDQDKTIFLKLNDAFIAETSVDLDDQGFDIRKIIPWDAQTAFVFGLKNNNTIVYKMTRDTIKTIYGPYPQVFADGLHVSGGRLLFVGQSGQAPALFEVDPESGGLNILKVFTSSNLMQGIANCITEAKDHGLIIGIQGASNVSASQVFIVRTDKNGTY